MAIDEKNDFVEDGKYNEVEQEMVYEEYQNLFVKNLADNCLHGLLRIVYISKKHFKTLFIIFI